MLNLPLVLSARRRAVSLVVVLSCVVGVSHAQLEPGHAQAQASVSSGSDQWKVVAANSLQETTDQCSGVICRRVPNASTAHLLPICMYRDPSTSGLLSRGEWRSHVGVNAPQACQEVLYADPQRKTMYVLARFEDVRGPQPYIYCRPGNWSQPGLEACASEFFAPRDANGSSYKVISGPAVQKVVQEAKVFAAIDQHLHAAAAQQNAQQRAEYLAEFERAKGSLQLIQQFEAKYGSNDPDALVPQLAALKQEFRLKEYEERFAKMTTISEIERFIVDYEQDDLGKKMPQARQRLAQEQQRVADVAKTQARQKAAEEATARLSELERKVIWCKRESAAARRSIEQENQIGRVSGFVNKQRLHAAGQTIVYCDRSAPNDFEEYKRLGGKKSYTELR